MKIWRKQKHFDQKRGHENKLLEPREQVSMLKKWTKFANYDHSDTLEIHGRTGGHRLRTFILICLLVYTDRTDIGGTVTAAQVSTI